MEGGKCKCVPGQLALHANTCHQLLMHIHSTNILNGSGLHIAASEDASFRLNVKMFPSTPQNEGCCCPIALPSHKVIAIHFKKHQWSSPTLQPGLFLRDSPSLLFVSQGLLITDYHGAAPRGVFFFF